MARLICVSVLALLLCGALASEEDSFMVNASGKYSLYPAEFSDNLRLRSLPPTSAPLRSASDFQRPHASRFIEAGETILAVGTQHAISADIISRELPDADKVQFSYSDEPFVLWLLYQRSLGAQSPHTTFLATLPQQLVNPLLFTNDEWAEIAVTPESVRVNAIANEERELLLATSKRLLAHLEEASPILYEAVKDVTLQEYIAAHLTVGDLVRRTSDAAFLFPAMLFAHDPSAGIPFLEDDMIVMKATRPLEAGQQVSINYGNISNSDLLLRHSTFLENNPHDCVFFSLKASSAFWAMVAEKVFGRADPTNYSACLPVAFQSNDPVLREMRAVVANHEEMDQLSGIVSGQSVSLRNEAHTLRALYFALQSQIVDYPPVAPEASDSVSLSYWKAYAAEHYKALNRAAQQILARWTGLVTEGTPV